MKTLFSFRRIAIAEGISFLLLLFVAMPLKYLAEMPQPVRIVGWIHGLLFIWYLFAAVNEKILRNRSGGWLVKAAIASVLPFGPFFIDRPSGNNIASM